MASARLPVSVVSSLALHAGALAAYVSLSAIAQPKAQRVIGNVDLLIQVHHAALPAPIQKAPTPPSTWNFLKMALPAIPKVEMQRLEVKVPDAHKPLSVQTPKLEDQGRRQELAKMQALDLSQKRPEMAQIDAKLQSHKTAALAAMPRLEEVGRRQVRNLPQAMALEERRQEAVRLQEMQALNVESTHRHVAPQMEALDEAQPPKPSGLAKKIADFLPTQEGKVELNEAMREAPDSIRRKLDAFAPAKLERRTAEALGEEKKKGVEIEGPLANRKVVAYDVPEFPDWAKQQGMLEASVAIRFWVSPEGDVLPDMRVERTSGYGRLDRLAMDSLKNWKFVAISASQRQWGVITFRFVLE